MIAGEEACVTCREAAEFLMDYLSGELPEDVRRAFEHHLQECEDCRNYLADYRTTVALGQRAFDDETAADAAGMPEELVRAILAARAQR